MNLLFPRCFRPALLRNYFIRDANVVVNNLRRTSALNESVYCCKIQWRICLKCKFGISLKMKRPVQEPHFCMTALWIINISTSFNKIFSSPSSLWPKHNHCAWKLFLTNGWHQTFLAQIAVQETFANIPSHWWTLQVEQLWPSLGSWTLSDSMFSSSSQTSPAFTAFQSLS